MTPPGIINSRKQSDFLHHEVRSQFWGISRTLHSCHVLEIDPSHFDYDPFQQYAAKLLSCYSLVLSLLSSLQLFYLWYNSHDNTTSVCTPTSQQFWWRLRSILFWHRGAKKKQRITQRHPWRLARSHLFRRFLAMIYSKPTCFEEALVFTELRSCVLYSRSWAGHNWLQMKIHLVDPFGVLGRSWTVERPVKDWSTKMSVEINTASK